ncbi:MAG: cyanophycin synthetase [Aphanocapsa sp. GSE-SYN-MK-11-07L]|jgi:cyanophycin synthetase|nr:cyanophycin synthetase [Aphanocapsa sp. GSE-SYN-MK-11-07L]
MKILKMQTLRGPNYWSIRRHKLIVMRLDLESLAEQPSNQIPGFYEGLVGLLPSLQAHFCSLGQAGGFLTRLREGTMMGHIIEHVALELQDLAGMPVGFGRTRQTATPGIYQVVMEYLDEQAGRYAARAAVRLCQSIVDIGSYSRSELAQDLADLQELWAKASLGPSTEAIVKEAEARGIPWLELSSRAIIQLGYGANQRRIQATLSDRTGVLAVELAGDKEGTKQMLADAGIPVPKGTIVSYLDDLEHAIADIGGYPVVIKPLNGNHGRGITIGVEDWEVAEQAYDSASAVSKDVIVEHYHPGSDHRVLVVNGKVVAVAERVPAHVVGDGRSTIEELIEITNQDPQRGEGHANVLTKIDINHTTWQLLDQQGHTLDSVLSAGEVCYLRGTANLSTGGIAVDRTDDIHPENVWIAQRAAQVIGLDIAGIDVVTPDITQPMTEVGGVIVEINAAPGFRMHTSPSRGIARNVAEPVIDMLFPPGRPCRIPIIAVTGTNGKTTTTRLIAHICRQTQRTVGYTTTDGIYVGDYLVEKGDTTGPQSARLILKDPTVEIAVLEAARGGILRSGLGFDYCDVGVILNVQADHLGIGDIDTLEQLADLKAVVAESARPDGYVILNADDPMVVSMTEQVKAQVAYFSMEADNPIVQDHIERGGLAAVYENGYLSILKGDWTLRIEQAINVPITLGGRANFMIANALAASLAAFCQGIAIEHIRVALASFRTSVSQTPGRMNLINLGKFSVLLDYAHNPAGYAAVGEFVKKWPGQRIGVLGAPGDRRNEDLISLGAIAAGIFNQVIVKEDDDRRGRDRSEVANLIVTGLQQAQPDRPYEVILDETTAINQTLQTAPAGSLIVILPDSVSRAISLVEEFQAVLESQAAVVEFERNGVASPIVHPSTLTVEVSGINAS